MLMTFANKQTRLEDSVDNTEQFHLEVKVSIPILFERMMNGLRTANIPFKWLAIRNLFAWEVTVKDVTHCKNIFRKAFQELTVAEDVYGRSIFALHRIKAALVRMCSTFNKGQHHIHMYSTSPLRNMLKKEQYTCIPLWATLLGLFLVLPWTDLLWDQTDQRF